MTSQTAKGWAIYSPWLSDQQNRQYPGTLQSIFLSWNLIGNKTTLWKPSTRCVSVNQRATAMTTTTSNWSSKFDQLCFISTQTISNIQCTRILCRSRHIKFAKHRISYHGIWKLGGVNTLLTSIAPSQDQKIFQFGWTNSSLWTAAGLRLTSESTEL